MAVTLEDVAKLAGCSMKTVSNVIHNYPHVRESTRKRVLEAIETLRYRPNLSARTLATGRTNTIALVVPDMAVPYFAELASFVAKSSLERGYRVMIEQIADNDIEGERDFLAQRSRGLVDGIIFHPVSLTAFEIASSGANEPLVLLGELVPPPSVDHVMIDNVGAAFDVTTRLIESGSKRIAFLGHEESKLSPVTSQRLVGYKNALAETGLMSGKELQIPTAGFGVEAAETALRNRLDSGLLVDAVVCYDDLAAIGALRALGSVGTSVPAQVSVTGWDNIHLSRYYAPSITSVAPDKGEIAEIALDLLTERIAGASGPGRHRIASHQIAVRESAKI